MAQIERVVDRMQMRMQRFESIGGHMHVMTGQTGVIADGMASLDARMKVIDRQMAAINGRLFNVTRSMGAMGTTVNGMGHSVSDVARPAGMFGFLP